MGGSALFVMIVSDRRRIHSHAAEWMKEALMAADPSPPQLSRLAHA
jgi:hypothetical protein